MVCHNRIMPSRSSKDHDFTTVARRVVEQAIGEHLEGTPLDDPNKGKNPAAVALGRLGGVWLLEKRSTGKDRRLE